MFERLHTPRDLLNHRLHGALDMEQRVLKMLADDAKRAEGEEVRQMLLRHREESFEHVRRLERAFALLGWELDTTSSPAIRGIEKEGETTAHRADRSLVDSVLLSGAAETEHHEIAVYEDLLTHSRALGRDDVATLLEENLANERATLRDVQAAEARMARADVAHHC
jgi:ferritin-like metal-binding protein YciE